MTHQHKLTPLYEPFDPIYIRSNPNFIYHLYNSISDKILILDASWPSILFLYTKIMIYSHLICNLEGLDYEVYISFKLRPPTWLALSRHI